MNHRDKKLDSYIGKRVKVIFQNGTTYKGLVGFNDESGKYVLKNCADLKNGFPHNDIEFRKSHIYRIEVG